MAGILPCIGQKYSDVGAVKVSEKFYESGKQKVENALEFTKDILKVKILNDDFSQFLDTYFIDITL